MIVHGCRLVAVPSRAAWASQPGRVLRFAMAMPVLIRAIVTPGLVRS